MDFVTITDHDTIDGCLRAGGPSRLLRLRGADRPFRRRAPGGSRPLLRDHSRGPRVAAGARRRRRGLRRIPSRERDRLRAGAPVLQRRRAADPAPPAPPGGALPGLGGPQRVARRGAEHARRRSTSRPTGAPASAAPTITPAWTSAAPSPRRPAASTPEEFLRHVRAGRRGRARRRAGQRRQVGARGDGARDSRPRPRRRQDRRRRGAPDPAAVLKMAQRVIGEGAAREGKVAADIGPDDARALLEAWLRLGRASSSAAAS